MNRSSNPRRRAEQIRRERARARGRTGSGEDGALLRLVVCGAVFVLLVAVKLLFPETVSSLTRSAGELIGRNADFKEAFAAVGRAISGEEPVSDSLQDAYTAVFHPAGPEEPLPASAAPSDTAPTSQAEPPVQASRTVQTTPDTADGPVGLTLPDLPAVDPETITETVIDLDADIPSQSGDPEAGDTATSEALSYVYTMPALPENASLEQRNLGFDHCNPLPGSLSSTFGWREHPVEGGSKFHYGVDLAAAEGADIAAFAAGTVYATGESSTLGNYIMLQHADGYITLYAHCSKVTVTGGSVAMGEKIAEVGATGLATGPHLHFELHDGGLYLNPIYYVDVG